MLCNYTIVLYTATKMCTNLIYKNGCEVLNKIPQIKSKNRMTRFTVPGRV